VPSSGATPVEHPEGTRFNRTGGVGVGIGQKGAFYKGFNLGYPNFNIYEVT